MSNGKKASHLLDQEDSRETSKPLRPSMHCWTFFHLVSPMCAWLANWRSPSKICTLGIHLDYRFSIWHSSVRCEVFLNHFPEKKIAKDTGRNVSASSPFWEFLWLWLAHFPGSVAFSRGLAIWPQHASSCSNNTSPSNKCGSPVQKSSQFT